MKILRDGAAATALLALLPTALAAHEGHGPAASFTGVVHWLSSPYHLVSVVAVLAVLGGVGIGVALRRRGVPADPAAEER